MKVRLVPEGTIVEAYLPISSWEKLLVKHNDPNVIKKLGLRWETRKAGSYEVLNDLNDLNDLNEKN